MDTPGDLAIKFTKYKTEMRRFFLNYSKLHFLLDSTNVVEGGVRYWLPLPAKALILREDIYSDYGMFIYSIIEESRDMQSLREFKLSTDRVLSFLEQQNIIIEKNVIEVYQEVERELNKQLFLITKI